MVPSLFLVVAFAVAPSFEISEVLLAPAAGPQIVEIVNTGSVVLDTGELLLISGATFQQIPSTPVAPGQLVRLHIGVVGSNTPADLFLPAVGPADPVADSFALYAAPAGGVPPLYFDDPVNIRDFIQWGAPQQPFAGTAEAGLVWFFASTFAPTPGAGESLAWRGSGKQATDWFRDASPTLGLPNVQGTAAVMSFGSQCTPAAAGPALLAPLPPALGNQDFRIDFWTQSHLQPGLLFLGTQLTSVPVFGGLCQFHVGGLFAVAPFISQAGDTSFAAPVPDVPALLGQRVVMQVAVQNGFGLAGMATDLSPALVIDV